MALVGADVAAVAAAVFLVGTAIRQPSEARGRPQYGSTGCVAAGGWKGQRGCHPSRLGVVIVIAIHFDIRQCDRIPLCRDCSSCHAAVKWQCNVVRNTYSVTFPAEGFASHKFTRQDTKIWIVVFENQHD